MLSSYLVRTSYHASATPEISTLSLHDALPISNLLRTRRRAQRRRDSQHCPQVRNQRHSWVTLLLQSERILRFPLALLYSRARNQGAKRAQRKLRLLRGWPDHQEQDICLCHLREE